MNITTGAAAELELGAPRVVGAERVTVTRSADGPGSAGEGEWLRRRRSPSEPSRRDLARQERVTVTDSPELDR